MLRRALKIPPDPHPPDCVPSLYKFSNQIQWGLTLLEPGFDSAQAWDLMSSLRGGITFTKLTGAVMENWNVSVFLHNRKYNCQALWKILTDATCIFFLKVRAKGKVKLYRDVVC